MKRPPKIILPTGHSDALATYGDKLWRMSHLYKIRDKDRRIVSLKPNAVQLRMCEQTQNDEPVRAFFLKSRQQGVSSWWLIWWLDDTIFTPNTITGILAHSLESLQHLWQILRVALENMPNEFKPQIRKSTEHEFAFTTNSRIFTSLSIRSTAVHNLHVSEACYVDSGELEATLAACSPKSNITLESTGNGVGGLGYELFQNAKLNMNGFKCGFFPWYLSPEYAAQRDPSMPPLIRTADETKLTAIAARDYGISISDEQILWRRMTQKALKATFQQEFPENDIEAFLTSGGRYFDGKKVMVLINEARTYLRKNPPHEQTEHYTAFFPPEAGHVYAAGADVAEGLGGDYSVLTILDATAGRTAFRYRGHMAIDAFAALCAKRAAAYNNCLLAVERNNHGHAVINLLREVHRYPNLYYESGGQRAVAREFIEPAYGWLTSSKTKPIMLDQLKLAVEGDSLEDEKTFSPEVMILDELFLSEALSFVEKDGKLTAEAGKHDDCIISLAIAYQMYLKEKIKESRKDFGILVGGRRESFQKLDKALRLSYE